MIRKKLAALLTGAGYPTEEDSLYPATGWWRSHGGDGNVRWEGWMVDGRHLMSYYTMTECVRRGISVKKSGSHMFLTREEFWIDAKR